MSTRGQNKRRTAERAFAIAARFEKRVNRPQCTDDPKWLLRHAAQTREIGERRQKAHLRKIEERWKNASAKCYTEAEWSV